MMITLPLPPSANTAYPTNRNGRRHMSKKGREWRNTANAILGLELSKLAVRTPLTLNFRLYFPDLRRRDIDNYVKLPKDAICDTLKIDDKWENIPELSVKGDVDRGNPRIEIEIEELL